MNTSFPSIARIARIAGSIFAFSLIAGTALAQTGQKESNKPAVTLKAGPADKLEIVTPGKIDTDAKPEFIETKSGLKYRILRKSDGKKPKATEKVTVHYKGWLDDETIFDSSYRKEKISFPLTSVIAGWTEGLQLVGVGGMIELDIPSELAYKARGKGAVPPNARLHFVIELYDVK